MFTGSASNSGILPRMLAWRSTLGLRPFFCTVSTTSAQTAAMSVGSSLTCIDWFLREFASRMSLTREWRRWPDCLMVLRCSFTLSPTCPQLPPITPSASPMMPLRGVRSSCEIAARKRSLCTAVSCTALTTLWRSSSIMALCLTRILADCVCIEQCRSMEEAAALERTSKSSRSCSSRVTEIMSMALRHHTSGMNDHVTVMNSRAQVSARRWPSSSGEQRSTAARSILLIAQMTK
mmetsp:Transcript_46543/g.110242  ORF Transcript_46543/g.110242 Transcript_46543/m.110242 type:complete len:235 (+) Transcript_46543:1420-2124(+)